MPPKVMSGPRALVGIYDPATGKTRIIGLFSNVSYSLSYETQAANILGAYAPVEIDYVGQNEVPITCSGYRVIDHGAHVDPAVPKLQDLLTHEYIELTIIDRQRQNAGGDGRIAKFRNVRPTGYSSGMQARNLTELTVNFVAIHVDDESATNNEAAGAANLP